MNQLPVKLLRVTTVPSSLKMLLKGQHRFLNQNGFSVMGVASSGNELNEVHTTEGIPVVMLEMTRTISPLKDLRALYNFYKLCKKEKPVMVHSHTPKAGIVGMLGAKLAGVPIRLHTVAGLPLMETSGVKRKILNAVEKLTYASATNVYPNSKGLYDFILENNYTTKNKLKVIGQGSSNGIDTSFFSPDRITEEVKNTLRTELNLSANDFVFVFVGRLVGDKGINELVEAFRMMTMKLGEEVSGRRGDGVKLLLVGPFESELDPLLPETLKIIETNANIISVGYQKDVRPYFAISDCLVFPSYREGFPNVVMQAGSMELPSIVSNINGCNEIVVEGENGTIIPVKNVEAIQIAMQKMSEDIDYYSKLKENARPMIQSRYEQQVVWNALLKEYNSLINKLSNKQII